MIYERPAIQMVAVKKVTMNHRSQRRLAQLGTVKKRSRDSGHMVSHFSLRHTPAGGGQSTDMATRISTVYLSPYMWSALYLEP